ATSFHKSEYIFRNAEVVRRWPRAAGAAVLSSSVNAIAFTDEDRTFRSGRSGQGDQDRTSGSERSGSAGDRAQQRGESGRGGEPEDDRPQHHSVEPPVEEPAQPQPEPEERCERDGDEHLPRLDDPAGDER